MNPLLEKALEADPGIVSLDWWRNPPEVDAWGARKELVKRYAWAIPNEQALEAIAAWSPLVEIGAGTGYWARLLAERGADIIAYDIAPGKNHWCDSDLFFPVETGGPEKAGEHSDRTLFLCWPPYNSDMAYRALMAYQGHRLAYIGELEGGCCADDQFFGALCTDWRLVQDVRIPQWWGLNDALYLYERD